MYSGTAYPLSSSLPRPQECCKFYLPWKWETPKKSFCRDQTLEGHWYSHNSKHLDWDLQRSLGKPPLTGFRVTGTSHSLSHSNSWGLLQCLSAWQAVMRKWNWASGETAAGSNLLTSAYFFSALGYFVSDRKWQNWTSLCHLLANKGNIRDLLY